MPKVPRHGAVQVFVFHFCCFFGILCVVDGAVPVTSREVPENSRFSKEGDVFKMGPLVSSGQILSGVEGKNAIGIASLAEGVTCALGVTIYLLTARDSIDWRLAPIIIFGAVCSVPFSVKSVKIISPRTLKIIISVVTVALGIVTLFKTMRNF